MWPSASVFCVRVKVLAWVVSFRFDGLQSLITKTGLTRKEELDYQWRMISNAIKASLRNLIHSNLGPLSFSTGRELHVLATWILHTPLAMGEGVIHQLAPLRNCTQRTEARGAVSGYLPWSCCPSRVVSPSPVHGEMFQVPLDQLHMLHAWPNRNLV